MNQSNKALRDEVAEKLAGLVNIYKYAESGYIATPKEKDVQNTATQAIALVTNHIKGRMPKDFVPDGYDPNACLNHDKYTSACCACQCRKTRVYTLDEVCQILKEMGE